DAARRRVHDAAEALGYVPDATARNLRNRQSDSIGVLVSDLTHPFSAEVAAGASTQARRRGYTVVLSDTGERTDTQSGTVEGTDTESEAAEALVSLRVA
ncbi:hypothetical protein PU560_00375, partial [Georgenia sp. 10Sc9-8]|nr:hypothetical protein [Georgenia halotolerans]